MNILFLLLHSVVLSSAITAAKLAGSDNFDGNKNSKKVDSKVNADTFSGGNKQGWFEVSVDDDNDRGGVDAKSVEKAEKELELIEKLERQGYISNDGKETRDIEIDLKSDSRQLNDASNVKAKKTANGSNNKSPGSGETFELEIEDSGEQKEKMDENEKQAEKRETSKTRRSEADNMDVSRSVGQEQKGPAEPAIIKHPTGQKEFVEFYDRDAAAAKQHVNKQTVSVKRAPELQFTDENSPMSFFSAGNYLLIGIVGGACLVATVVVIMALYYRHRTSDPFASSCGAHCSNNCGKKSVAHMNEQKRRTSNSSKNSGKGNKGKVNPDGVKDKGDRDMAYDAHLHHYQQNKAKILHMQQAAAAATGVDCPSDDSEADDQAGDCSVYECPGLAPTGDIEVANPMFHPPSPMLQKENEPLEKSAPLLRENGKNGMLNREK